VAYIAGIAAAEITAATHLVGRSMRISELIVLWGDLICTIGPLLVLIWLFRSEKRRLARDEQRNQSTEDAFRAALSDMAPLKGDPRSGPAWVAPVRWGSSDKEARLDARKQNSRS
jgi:hypothetical protein